ncbi:MAG: isochorismatase family protein [Planctomycetota bacterium]|nr:MAG: isochorismatase family protein [Planctomycetota bacterium]
MPHFQCTIGNTLLLVIDVQERFAPAIPAIAAGGPAAASMETLVKGCQLLGIPTLISQQYPRGLGQTLGHIQKHAPEAQVLDKTHFSAVDDPAIRGALAASEADYIIVCGIEAHICVLATVADLQQRGYQALVCSDGIASRNPQHCESALASMRQLGALAMPAESILFRLQRQAGVGAFKALQGLVK